MALLDFVWDYPESASTRNVKPGRQNQSGFTGARDSEWQWHQMSHMQICTLTQIYNHASIPPLSFLQAGCPSCRPTNSVKALKARTNSIKAVKASQHQKGKPFWILTKQEMTRWQWHQLDHMQIICTSLQTDNHASTTSLKFL